MVALNPTRGLDVGAAEFVHGELASLLDRGGAVVLISTDLDEILTRASHVAVMSGGCLKEISNADRSRERVALAMSDADEAAEPEAGET